MIRCFSLKRGTLWSVYLASHHLQVRGHTCLRGLSTMRQTSPPILSVVPTRALADEKFKVVVENLPPASPVTLHSLHKSDDKDYWEAYGHYISDHRGVVSVADDLSFGGTYTGKEAMGLLWSACPIPGSREGLGLRKMNICTPMLVNISVYSEFLSEGFMEKTPLASALVERWYMAPGVQRLEIRENGVRGTLFVPPGPGPFPGMLDLLGGRGGLMEGRAALLASHGYASLALEYFATGQLETADLELKYFEKAFNVIKDHPQVIPDKIGIFGLSLGSGLAIYLAAESTVVKPLCCVCVSGSHCFPVGKTLKAVQQEFHKSCNDIYVDENNRQVWRGMGLAILRTVSNKVNVGKLNCPILLVNGHDDQNWPTVESAAEMAQAMRAAGNEHLLTILLYPKTGHLIDPPFSPHNKASNFPINAKKEKVMMLWGGETKPHTDAQEDSWKKILAFLRHHMYLR